MEIQDTKIVWVAYSNTDCTEGRGQPYPFAVGETEETAKRLGKRQHVMGSDCPVYPKTAVKVNNEWLVPGRITAATEEDKKRQAKADMQKSVIDRMRAAGFTDDEINSIS